jgi:hypothetical protein
MEISADRAQWEKHLSYYIQGSTGEIGGDYDFTIICNTKRFVMTVSPSSDPDDKARLLLSQAKHVGQTTRNKSKMSKTELTI